jgi:hypothetical protein
MVLLGALVRCQADETNTNAMTLDRFNEIMGQAIGYTDKQFGMTPTLRWTDAVGSRALPDGSIELSGNQIWSFLNPITDSNRILAADVMLGHEYAHVWQFKQYDVSKSGDWGGKILESQADVIANWKTFRPLFSHINEVDLDLYPPEESWVFYNVGSEPFALGQHASRITRQHAFRIGLLAGLFDKCGESKQPDANLKKVSELARKYLPFHPTKIDEKWALNAAKCLAHSSGDACSKLQVEIIESRSDELPIPDRKNPYVLPETKNLYGYYTVSFKNDGTRPLRVYWGYSVVYRWSEHPDNSFQWHWFDEDGWEFILKPGKAVRKAVKVDMFNSRSQYLYVLNTGPELITAPSDGSLWYVEYSDDPNPLPVGSSTNLLNIPVNSLSGETPDSDEALTNALYDAQTALLAGIEGYRSSPNILHAGILTTELNITAPGLRSYWTRNLDGGMNSGAVVLEKFLGEDEGGASVFYDHLSAMLKNLNLKEVQDTSRLALESRTFSGNIEDRNIHVSVSAYAKSIIPMHSSGPKTNFFVKAKFEMIADGVSQLH